MEAILLAQAELDVGPAGARRSQSLRPSRPVRQPARFSQPLRAGQLAAMPGGGGLDHTFWYGLRPSPWS